MNKHGPLNILSSIDKVEWNGMELDEKLRSFVFLQQFAMQYKINEDWEDRDFWQSFDSDNGQDHLRDFTERVEAVFLYLIRSYFEFMYLVHKLEHLSAIKPNVVRFSPFDCFDWFEKKYYQYLGRRMLRIHHARNLSRNPQWRSYMMDDGFDDMKRWRTRFDDKRLIWNEKQCEFEECESTKWKCKGCFWM